MLEDKEKSNKYGSYWQSIVVMCSYGRLLMRGHYLRGLLPVIISQLPLITCIAPYYTWSLKHSPLKWQMKREQGNKERKWTNKGPWGRPWSIWCLEHRGVRNTRSIHHFVFWCGNTAYTHMCSGMWSIARQGHLSNAITFLLIPLIAYLAPNLSKTTLCCVEISLNFAPRLNP